MYTKHLYYVPTYELTYTHNYLKGRFQFLRNTHFIGEFKTKNATTLQSVIIQIFYCVSRKILKQTTKSKTLSVFKNLVKDYFCYYEYSCFHCI